MPRPSDHGLWFILLMTFYDFLCPSGEPPNLCCNAAQLQELKDGMSLARQMLSRCPVCYRNILKFNCNFMCSPQQSLFMKATKTEPVPEGEGGEHLQAKLQAIVKSFDM